MAVTFTQAQIDEFKTALLERKGAISTSFDGQQVTFENHEQAVKFLAFMERHLDTGAAGTSRTRYGAVTKGV
jgi:hypothetical protein